MATAEAPLTTETAEKFPDPPKIPQAVQLRHRALSPFLEQFREWSSQLRDPHAVPFFAEIANRSIDLGCWERAVLKQTCAAERADRRPLERVAEGVAYQAQCLGVLGRFTHGPMPQPSELPQFLDQLVTDVALGIALAEELQWEVDELVAKGELAHAKSLADFRDKVVQCLADLQGRVGAAELEQAQQRARTLVALELRPERPAGRPAGRQVPRLLDEQEPNAPSWAAFGPGRPEATPPAQPAQGLAPAPAEQPPATARPQVKRLLYLLVALTVLYGLVSLPRIDSHRLSVLALEQFAHLEAVRRIQARPPSLFVTLDSDRWRELSPADRRDLVTQIGLVAKGAGYSGVHVRTDDGPSVGQWLRKTGVQLWTRSAGAT